MLNCKCMSIVKVTYVFSFISLNMCCIEKNILTESCGPEWIFIFYVMYDFLVKGQF
jgi:hypothetical protein